MTSPSLSRPKSRAAAAERHEQSAHAPRPSLPRLKLRALAGRSLSVFLSLSIQAVAYLPVEYSSRARNGDRCGKEAEMHNELGCVSCSVLPFCFSDRPPKIFLPRRFYPEGTSQLTKKGAKKRGGTLCVFESSAKRGLGAGSAGVGVSSWPAKCAKIY